MLTADSSYTTSDADLPDGKKDASKIDHTTVYDGVSEEQNSIVSQNFKIQMYLKFPKSPFLLLAFLRRFTHS